MLPILTKNLDSLNDVWKMKTSDSNLFSNSEPKLLFDLTFSCKTQIISISFNGKKLSTSSFSSILFFFSGS